MSAFTVIVWFLRQLMQIVDCIFFHRQGNRRLKGPGWVVCVLMAPSTIYTGFCACPMHGLNILNANLNTFTRFQAVIDSTFLRVSWDIILQGTFTHFLEFPFSVHLIMSSCNRGLLSVSGACIRNVNEIGCPTCLTESDHAFNIQAGAALIYIINYFW